jgi:hypothetical protein
MNSLSGNKMMKEYEAQILAENLIVRERINKNFKDEIIETENVTISKIIDPDKNIPNLYKLTIQVFSNNGTLLAESKCYIRYE